MAKTTGTHDMVAVALGNNSGGCLQAAEGGARGQTAGGEIEEKSGGVSTHAV